MKIFSAAALRWLESILHERFGHVFKLIEHSETLEISLPNSRKTVIFDRLQSVFHQPSSDFSCTYWKASEEGYEPPIYDLIPAPSAAGLMSPLIEVNNTGATVHYDILGLTYWMLSRLEEIGRHDLDEHGRFPASSSHAFMHDYLERPIVDEWLIILSQVVEQVWPGIRLKEHKFGIQVSHDVDIPARYAFNSLKGLIRSIGGDVVKRGDFPALIKAPWIWLNSSKEIHPLDPFNTFEWLMDQSERNGLTSAFYFICGRTDASKDAQYDPEMPQIRKLMREIHRRGHEIGLHPSYKTYNCPEAIAWEADRLRKVCANEGIYQNQWGGRMHFLRWDQSITQKAWADSGLSYDSTLSYADRPGFRCGTCFEYPAFDVSSDQALSLRIRPLIAMDCTVIAERYLGLGSTDAAFDKFYELKSRCEKVGGVFTLLWHNSFFNSPRDFEIYSRIIAHH